ncbi:MAG: hypothetical protein ACRDRU_23280 [Pseudonocardiaceae bacterium]
MRAVRASISPLRPSAPVHCFEPVTFAESAADAAGMSLTVLRPEKVKGGVRLTIERSRT